jgi:hypothetical protein
MDLPGRRVPIPAYSGLALGVKRACADGPFAALSRSSPDNGAPIE